VKSSKEKGSVSFSFLDLKLKNLITKKVQVHSRTKQYCILELDFIFNKELEKFI
jgi:hypothetical protein